MLANNLFKSTFFTALSFLLSTTGNASYQGFLPAEEESHTWTSEAHSGLYSTASAIDYGWDTTKILLTAGSVGIITFGIGPRVADITNWLFPTIIPTIKWAYNRSEIGPLTADLYAKTKRLRDKIPDSSLPPFTIPISSIDMSLKEVLPVGLKDLYCHELMHLNQLLSEGITDSNKVSTLGWKKLPLYGKFENAQKTIIGHLSRGSLHQDYLIGYVYKSARYVVQIERLFNKPGIENDPATETCEKDFYRIHRSFKQKDKGKRLEAISYYTEEHNPHPYLKVEHLKNVKDKIHKKEVKSFMRSFVKSSEHSPFSKKAFTKIFNNLAILTSMDFTPLTPHSSSSFMSVSQRGEEQQEKEGGIEQELDEYLEQEEDIEEQVRSTSKEEVPVFESSSYSFLEHNKVQLFMAKDEQQRHHKYLCFLFPTNKAEHYNILLKIKDKVSYDFFLSSDDMEEDLEEPQAVIGDRKGKKIKSN